MIAICPVCRLKSVKHSLNGSYYRKSDRKHVLRYRCFRCDKSFSQATHSLCYEQNKRHLNFKIKQLLCSGMSQRRIAILLKISRTTVARKLSFLALKAQRQNEQFFLSLPLVIDLQFDDLETFEHSKCKPISVIAAVENKTRKILGFEVSMMPAKGHLAEIARKRYGYRRDERRLGREKLFERLQKNVSPQALFSSDQSPHYPRTLKKYFPQARHIATAGRRGCVVGQGELKRGGFDPLFSLNHSFAMFRANINRLMRKTWCTTKKLEKLAEHIELYVEYHNQVLLKKT